MKNVFLLLATAVISLGLAVVDAEAARFGGARSIGKQRSSPTMREAQKDAPNAAAAPAAPAQAAAGTPPRTQAQPGFMGRWGGMLAGLGLGALVGSLFGGNLGGMGGLLSLLLIGGAIYLLLRLLASRRRSAAPGMQYAGADNRPAEAGPMSFEARSLPSGSSASAALEPGAANLPPGFEVEPFIRQAKTAFIRLQAANDVQDLDDIRDYTTPEMYAEIAMQVRERAGAPQKTEVLTLNAQLLEAVVEGDYAIASVRYSGLIRETSGANADSFDEVWHVRKNVKDPKSTWLIAGIQQVA
jgi:predicted lipid-binding transport protein (Tim44 family)